jgi:hypothetical protein
MKDKPDIQKIKQVAPEASDLEEIGSGGFKVVYKAQITSKIEAVKLVQSKNVFNRQVFPISRRQAAHNSLFEQISAKQNNVFEKRRDQSLCTWRN